MSGASLSPVIFTPAPAPARALRAGLGDTQLEALYQSQPGKSQLMASHRGEGEQEKRALVPSGASLLTNRL